MPTNENSKSLNLKDVQTNDPVEEIAPEVFQTLIIEDVKYKTRLSKKFLNRKTYEPVNPKKVISFIPGNIKKIYTKKGKKVRAGDKLIDLEAMKMVNTIFAHENHVIEEIYVKEGEMVPKNKLLMLYR